MLKAERLARARFEMEKTLKRTGVTALKKAGVKAKRPDFPDYSCPSNAAPTTNGFGQRGQGLAPFTLPDGAREFPVGHNHKQGYQLIVATDDLSMMGGKKT